MERSAAELSRRGFLGVVPGLALSGALSNPGLQAGQSPVPHRAQSLRILVLGGTGFLGPHMIQAALDRGHEVTLFNRGRTNPHLFPDLEKIVGDRGGDLSGLAGRTWDVVVDNSGYVPAHVEASSSTLMDRADHYIFTSTTDVYRDYHTPGMTEDYPLGVVPDGEPHDPRRWYGQLKVLCEEAVRRNFPERSTVIRPTWVVGPGDTNHLWGYWVMRMQDGGEILAPGGPEGPMQWIDVRDIADFVNLRAERRDGGTYHLVAPPMRMDEMLYGIRALTARDVTLRWVHEDFLWEQGTQPWVDYPLWWPPRNDYGEPVFGGIKGGEGSALLDGSRAWAAGLNRRPLADTARATMEWYVEDVGGWDYGQRPGLTREREAEILSAWAAR